MPIFLTALIALCAGMLVRARAAGPHGARLRTAASTILVGLVVAIVWGLLLMLHVVQIEPIMRLVGAYRLEQPWTQLLFLTPPIVAAGAYAWFATRRA